LKRSCVKAVCEPGYTRWAYSANAVTLSPDPQPRLGKGLELQPARTGREKQLWRKKRVFRQLY